jgi:peptidoglycan/xylan/chitin deacetylase (PgdA/CDA1 family)
MIKRAIAFLIALACLTITAAADQVHRVSPGETISAIAAGYGITADSLLANNQYIADPNRIYQGQVLIVPGADRQAYIVRPGDTLHRLSQRFGLAVALLAGMNAIEHPDRLSVGQVLRIPEVYTVRPKDTLYHISRSLGVDAAELAALNGLADIDRIFVGQRLVLPLRPSGRETLADFDRELAPLADRFPGVFFYKGRPGRRQVALTFDDGPSGVATGEILDLLGRYRVPATFFLLAGNLEGRGDILRRMAAEGHTLANHTAGHPDLRGLTPEQLAWEVGELQNRVADVTGLKTALLRPPYGFISDENLRQLSGMNYKIINWSVDSKDWRDIDRDRVLINTLPEVRDGSIILLHDAFSHAATLQAVEDIIQSLGWQGYRFVTVNELLDIEAYQ